LGGSNVNVSANATLTFDRSDDITYTGEISGGGTVRSVGAGKVNLTGKASGFKGTLQVASGQDVSLSRITATNALVNNSGTFGLNGSQAFMVGSRITGSGMTRLTGGATLSLGLTEMDFANTLSASNGVLALAVTNRAQAQIWQLDRLTLNAGTVLEVGTSGLWGKYVDVSAPSNTLMTLASAEAFFAANTIQLVASSCERGEVFDFGSDVTGTSNAAFFPGKYKKPFGQAVANFSAMWKGKIRISEPGTYTFATTSDDASIIYIDGALVVNNSGSHAMQLRSGTVALTNGLHDISIFFQQGGGGFGLYSDITFPGETVSRRLPNAMLVADVADTPAYTLTADVIAVTNGPGTAAVSFMGPGKLVMKDLWIDTGTQLAVTGAVAMAGTTLTVTVPKEVPYGVTYVGDFRATPGLALDGVTQTAVGTTGVLRYRDMRLYIVRNNGMMLILR
jgi:hypothetical protein